MKNILSNNLDELRLGQMLSALCAHPGAESEWLNLLSLLEYVGCRKIVKNVRFAQVDRQVLRHIAEEASHAFLLKVESENLAGAATDWTHSPLSAVGWDYFRELDTRISELRGNRPDDCYPAVSWAIETRVLWVYPRYLETTKATGVRRALTRILAQEKRHGAQFDEEGFSDEERAAFLAIEKPLWDRFIHSILNHFQARRPQHADAVSLA